MGRRKTQWLAKARKLGAEALYRAIPSAKVVSEGRKAYLNSQRPNSGAGTTVTLPISARKRQLVEKWAKELK